MASNSLGTLTLDLVARIGGFTAPLDQAERQARKRGKGIAEAANEASTAWTNLGKVAGLAFAGVSVAGVFTKFIAETRVAEQEQAQLAAVLASTGNAAGFSQQQLNDMADSLEGIGNRSAGEINNAQTALLAFTGIVGNQFVRAQASALDMSARTGLSIVTTAETIGRALDVPSKGMAALSRQGFRFTEDQKALIQSLEETGRVAEAQDIILRALEETYGGAAAAARDTFDGALLGLQHTIDSLLTGEGSLENAKDAINAVSDALASPAAKVAIEALTTTAIGLAVVLAGRVAAGALTSAAAFAMAQREAMRYQAALATMAGVSSAAATRIAAVGVAARASSAAMALLGGPVGLAVLAGGALLYLATSASSAEQEAAALDERLGKLAGSFEGLGEAARAKAIQDYNDKLAAVQASMEKAERQAVGLRRLLESRPDSSAAEEWQRKLLEVNAQIERQRGEVAGLQGDLVKLAQAGAGAASAAGEVASKAYTDLAARMNEQILLHGKETEAAKLEARIKAGLIDGLKAGEAELLIAQAKTRDGQIADAEAQKKREEAAKRASQAAVDAAKAIQNTVDGYAMQAATVGMSSRELALFKLQADGATDAQLRMADGALLEIERREQVAKAVAQHVDALREQRAVEAEIEAFRRQQNLAVQGMGLGGERRAQLQAEFDIQEEYAQKRLALEEAQRVESTRLDADAYKQRVDSLERAEREKIAIVRESAQARLEAEQDWVSGVDEALQNYADNARNYYQQAADATTSILNGATSSVSQGLQDIITGTEEVDDAFANMAAGMANAVVKALADMAAQWLAYQVVQMLVGKTTQAGAMTAMVGNATASSMQAGINAFASTAAIPIVGPAMAPAAMAAALATTAPLVAGVASAASAGLAGMAHDGIDSVPADGTWFLQKGERVTTAETSAKLDRTLDDVSRQGGGGGITINAPVSVQAQPGMSQQDAQRQGDQMARAFRDGVVDILRREMGQGGVLYRRG
nr:phage tail tape measure C-terminal domain-containing protein [uncultured Pseudomonas sp.]